MPHKRQMSLEDKSKIGLLPALAKGVELNSIKARKQQGREAQVRCRCRIWSTEFDSLGLRAWRVSRDANRGRSVSGRVRKIYRCFESRHKPFVAVGRWVCDCGQSGSMLQK